MLRADKESLLLSTVFNCTLVCSGVVPQSPANGFANEEFLFMSSLQTELEQSVCICLLLEAKLKYQGDM